MKFDTPPTPEPKWGSHLDTTSRLTLAMLRGRRVVVQRDMGDEQEEELNDGLDPMTAE